MVEQRKRVAVVPGDDAEPEAMAATMAILDAMPLPIEWIRLEPGQSLDHALADSCDSVLFGSSSGTTKGLAHLRSGWGTYANVRPVKWRRGVPSALRNPEGIDYVIVRESLEDVYAGIEGPLPSLLTSGLDLTTLAQRSGSAPRYPMAASRDGVYAIKTYTREVVERVAGFAARLAMTRREAGHAGRVTIGGKWNVNPRTDGFFRRVATEVISGHAEIRCDSYLADDLGRRLVMNPQEFDVVLLPNLFGDLLSDVGIAGVGGLGVAPSGGYGDDRAYFEPIHGSAPDIAGRHVINPTATILSAAMLLDHLGLEAEATRLEAAVDAVLAEGTWLTPDLGGSASTEAFAAAVAERC